MPQLRARLQRALVALVLLLAPAAAATDVPPEGETPLRAHEPARAGQAMVATANRHASEAGLAVLAEGGSAVDAAIAAQLVLNLVEPQSSGLGGGAFLLHWDAQHLELTTLDGREKAPAAVDPGYFLKPDGTPLSFWDGVIGGRSVGVPGTPALLAAAHERWGKLPWERLIDPALTLARDGFAISPRLAAAIVEGQERALDRFPTTRAHFFTAEGAPKAAGTVLRNPDFAATLEALARDGTRPFYEGAIGQALVEAVRTAPVAPGVMTVDDLAGYAVVEREPVCLPYRHHLVCGMGPPSSGGLAVLQILGLLEHFDMATIGPSADGVHLLLEAMKLAMADRNLYVADPDFVRVPTAGMTDPAYLTARAQLISLDRALPTPAAAGNPPWRETLLRGAAPDLESAGTSHLVTVDAAGSAVSMTTTIEAGMGSRLMSGGFLLNNELTDFAFAPEVDGRPVANRVAGGKRPRSSMAPMIVFDLEGRPILLLGSPGGSRIIGYVAKTLVAVLDWGMALQEAVDHGNVVNLNGPSELERDTTVAAFADILIARGHEVRLIAQTSGVQAIGIGPSGLVGAADRRREGVALGR